MADIKEATEKFLEYYRPKYRKHGYRHAPKTVENLLLQLKGAYSGILETDRLGMAMDTVVRGYMRNKSSAIHICRLFCQFLSEKYGITATVQVPPVETDNQFERLLYLAKELQQSEKTVGELADELQLSTRAINNDLARLRGTDPLQVCGKPFIVHETTKRKGRLSFASTVHPFFLTFNLTQVLTVLKGLKKLSRDRLLSRYALSAARSVWEQLSPYAKERLLFVLTELMPEEVDWYERLEESDGMLFHTEKECSATEGSGVLMDCLKNKKPCFIEYAQENGESVFYTNSHIRKVCGGNITIECDQGRFTLLADRVLRSAYSKEELP